MITYIDIIIAFLVSIHRRVSYLKETFRDWILSPSSGKNLLSWAQLIELVPISGHQN
jgi:hypothetical protein